MAWLAGLLLMAMTLPAGWQEGGRLDWNIAWSMPAGLTLVLGLHAEMRAPEPAAGK